MPIYGNIVGGIDEKIQVDTSLSVSGAAADAKAAGDKIAESVIGLETEINKKAPDGYGLGGSGVAFVIDNIDNLKSNGWYYSSSATGYNVCGTNVYYVFLRVDSWTNSAGTNYVTQTMYSDGKIYQRGCKNGTWDEWINYSCTAFAPDGLVTYDVTITTEDELNDAINTAYEMLGTRKVGFVTFNVTESGLTLSGGVWHVTLYKTTDQYGHLVCSTYGNKSVYRKDLNNGLWGEWRNIGETAFAPADHEHSIISIEKGGTGASDVQSAIINLELVSPSKYMQNADGTSPSESQLITMICNKAVELSTPGIPMMIPYTWHGRNYGWAEIIKHTNSNFYCKIFNPSFGVKSYFTTNSGGTWNEIASEVNISSDSLPTIPISKGGTGGTTVQTAFKNLLTPVPAAQSTMGDNAQILFKTSTPSDTDAIYYRPVSQILSYVNNNASFVKLSGGELNADAKLSFKVSGAGVDRRCHVGIGGIQLTANSSSTSSWAGGITYYKNDGSTELSAIGALGKGGTLQYIYLGGSYDSPEVKIVPSKGLVLTSKNYGTSLPTAGTAGRIFFKKV